MRDTVYIWKPVPSKANIYKIGITSSNIANYRLKKVAQYGKFKDIEIIIKKTVGNARLLESQLLRMGNKVSFDFQFDGFSEFRELTDEQLALAISMIEDEAEKYTNSPAMPVKNPKQMDLLSD